MCFLMDLDVARDAHVQRTRTLEARNRRALRGSTHRRVGARRGWQGLALTAE